MGWLSHLTATPASSQVGAGKRVYAVGDVHGRRDLLETLLGHIFSHAASMPPAQKTLIFMGDYVDRGPDSKGVIDCLLGLNLIDWKLIFLRGNHDQAVLDFLEDANYYRSWRSFGAPETLLSYGVTPPRFERETDFEKARKAFSQLFPKSHLEFLKSLPHSHIEDDYMFAHAGIRPGIPVNEQIPEDLMWIRGNFLSYRGPLPKTVVHGHTPTDEPIRHYNRIGIDTGAYATGRLTAAVLDGQSCTFLQTNGRRSTKPVQQAAGT